MDFATKLLEATGKGYVSYSALKYAADGSKSQDMKLFEMYMLGLLKKESDALTFGSLYDCMLLEPEKLQTSFIVLDDSDVILELGSTYKNPRSSNPYKEWKKEQEEKVRQHNLTIVSKDDWVTAERMIERLNNSEVINHETGELTPVKHYLTGTTQHEINAWIGDVPVRGFLDCYSKEHGFIADSKSTRSIHGFRYDVGNFCYDIQAYIYTQVLGTNEFYWVVQEKSSPYLCGVYRASDRSLASGEEKFWTAIANINKWLNNGARTETFALYGEI